jgi:hypothetical protein
MTKVMAGMFIVMLAAIMLGSAYLGGEITGDQLSRLFGVN